MCSLLRHLDLIAILPADFRSSKQLTLAVVRLTLGWVGRGLGYRVDARLCRASSSKQQQQQMQQQQRQQDSRSTSWAQTICKTYTCEKKQGH